MTEWRGVPLQKAVIVRHTPRDFSARFNPKASGAVSMASVGRGLEYIGRYGDFEERGQIERGQTASDRGLADEWGRGDYLEYISREGDWESKGADRQVDASLWGPRGPVSYDAAAREMREAGGAFVPSIVSVDRRYAERLGLEDKGSMQDLMRATWSRNVEQWGLIRDHEDIRWVAAYHTDAAHSVHVHVFTWSARGEIEPGATVGREGTRAGREIINERAYAGIREERNARSTLLRDMSRAELARQLGRDVDPERAASLDRRAAALGYPERVSAQPDIAPDGRERIARLEERLAGQLAGGRGRVSRNWEARGTAADIVREVERSSASFRNLSESWRECSEAKADLKALTGQGHARERERLIADDRRDWVERGAYAVIECERPDRERAGYRSAAGRSTGGYGRASEAERDEARCRARDRRRRTAERDREAWRRMSDRDRDSVSHAADVLGISRRDAVRMGRELGAIDRSGARSWEDASPAARGAAYGFAREAVGSPQVQRLLDARAADAAAAHGTDPAREREAAEREFVNHIARYVLEHSADPAGGRERDEADRGRGAAQGISPGSGLSGLAQALASASVPRGTDRTGRSRGDREAERQRYGREEGR